PGDKLAPALRLVDAPLRERFFQNLSARQVDVLKEELNNGPPIRRSDALTAQSDIVDAALKLAAEGRISINATEELV
ncbi:MAG TPA: FliG C-terminal domain-containing protein, partial [Acidocella sp.]|nr:FliG C-terminal domain-containing protein [Acidocella sp.]